MSSQALARLSSKIAGKTVCLLGQGPTVGEIELHLHRFSDQVVWASQTFFWAVEPIIENGLGRRFDLVYQSSPQLIRDLTCMGKFIEFLARPDDNLLLTTTGAIGYWDEQSSQLRTNYPGKIIIGRVEPGSPNPPEAIEIAEMAGMFFSFVFMILMLMKGGASNILLFGFDGGRPGGQQQGWYWGKPDDYFGWWGSHHNYGSEVTMTNCYWTQLVAHAGLSLERCPVINVTSWSQLECFPKIGYGELEEFLRRIS